MQQIIMVIIPPMKTLTIMDTSITMDTHVHTPMRTEKVRMSVIITAVIAMVTMAKATRRATLRAGTRVSHSVTMNM